MAGCDRQRAIVDYAKDLVEAGEYERALELLNQVDSIRNRPELDALRGTILSLEPATMVDGIFLMNRSVDALDDAVLRQNLFQAYIDTGLYARAGNLVSGERVGPDKFFRSDIVHLRSALRCYENPDPVQAGKLLEDRSLKKDHDPFLAPLQNSMQFYALLCLAKGIRNVSGESDLYWVLDDAKRDAKLKSIPASTRPRLEGLMTPFLELLAASKSDDAARRNRCEMLARMGNENAFSSPPESVRQELEECKKSYPGSLVLRRIWPVNLEGLNAERGGPMLFDESPFFPEYVPRPEFEPSPEDSLPDPAYPAIGPG